uniref:Organic solute transporter alpha-like protein 2 n=1 Tax=Steinernema glaseri TaxID=37863 RepID=A0A1I7XWV5_9BILA
MPTQLMVRDRQIGVIFGESFSAEQRSSSTTKMVRVDCANPQSLSTNDFVTGLGQNNAVLVMLVVASACSVGIVLLGFIQFYYVARYLSHPWLRGNMAFLVALFPVCTFCSISAMYVPSAGNLLFTFSYSYAIICLYRLVSVIKDSFGSWEAASISLSQSKTRIHFRVAPICCCMPCLPTVEPSVWYPISTGIVTASVLVGVFGCHALCKLSLEKLGPFQFVFIYRIVDATQAFYGLQSLVLYIIAATNNMPCGELLTPSDKVFWYNHFMLICEMFIMSLIVTFSVSPSRSAMFDLHPDAEKSQVEIAQHAQCRRCTVANITRKSSVESEKDDKSLSSLYTVHK